MAKKSRTKRPEILNRTVDITSFRTSLRVGVDEPKDPEPEIEVKQWLELRGCAGRSRSADIGHRSQPLPGPEDKGGNRPSSGRRFHHRGPVRCRGGLQPATRRIRPALVVRALRPSEARMDGVHQTPLQPGTGAGDFVFERARGIDRPERHPLSSGSITTARGRATIDVVGVVETGPVICGECGRSISESPQAAVEDRKPCAECGSVTRAETQAAGREEGAQRTETRR